MAANKSELNDVAIYWPRKRTISAIRRTGRCPSYNEPRRLAVPGGRVALVDESGSVRLLFRIEKIERRRPVTAADGNRYEQGCVLVAKPGSLRGPGTRDPKVLSVNRHAPGAFAYFDGESYSRVLYESGTADALRIKTNAASHQHFPSRRYALFANNIGKTLSQPERHLIQEYTNWVGDTTMFAHHPLKETGLYTDLFIPRCWTLFEAKASIRRTTLREAIGQLYDYQRHYDRHPRLAVLLPERPSQTVLELFERRRIIVVWRSRRSFVDSADGVLTEDLRSFVGKNGRLER